MSWRAAALIAWAVVGSVAALPTIAAADPDLAWHAPSELPERGGRARARRAAARRAVARSLRRSASRSTSRAIATRYVAHVGGRTLTSPTCDDLTDAVAIVIARIAFAVPARPSEDMDVEAVVPTTPDSVARPSGRWTAGARLSFVVSGIGSVPDVGIGGELAVVVQRDRIFAEVAGSEWVSSDARVVTGAAPRMDVGLHTMTVRAGYAALTPLRGWAVVDVGALSGTGEALDNARMGSGPWVAVGAGFGVAWPMARAVRVVGTLEVLAAIEHRTTFELGDGQVVYQPAPASARATFGLEVGWQ